MASSAPAFELFVGGLRHSTNERKLLDVFQQFGEIEKLQIKRHKDTHKSLGYAFITFHSKDAWERALNFGPQDIEGRPISIKVANQAADIATGRRRRRDQAIAPPGFDKRRLQRLEEQHHRSRERSPARGERSDTRQQLPPPPPPPPLLIGVDHNDQSLQRSPSPSPVEAKRRRTRSPSPVTRNGDDTFAHMMPSPAPAEPESVPLPAAIASSEPQQQQPSNSYEAQAASVELPTLASADRYSPHSIEPQNPESLEQQRPASLEPKHVSPETNRQSSPLPRHRDLEGHRGRDPGLQAPRERSSNDMHRQHHQGPDYRGRSPGLRRPQLNPPPVAFRPRSPQLRRPRSPNRGRRGRSPLTTTMVPRPRSPLLQRTRSPEPWRTRSPDAHRAVGLDVRRPVAEVRLRNPSPRIARPAIEVAPMSANGAQQLYYELQDANERQLLLKQQVDMLTRKSEMSDRRLELMEAKTRELETYLDAAYKEIQQLHNRFQQVVPYARQSERSSRGGAQVPADADRVQHNAGNAGPDGSSQRYSEPYAERNSNHSKYPRQNHFDDSDTSEPSR